MPRFALKTFAFALTLSFAAQAWGQPTGCAQLLEPGRQAKLLERLNKLNPELHKKFDGQSFDAAVLERLYLSLKEEAWKYLPQGQLPWKDRPPVNTELDRHIRAEYSKQFDTEKLTEDGLYLFYANALWSLYNSVYQNWVNEIVEQMASGAALTRELKGFGVSLLSRGLIDFDMQSPSTRPEIAAEVFAAKSWEKFSWAQAFKIAAAWYEVTAEDKEPLTYENLREWLGVNPAYLSLSASEKNMVVDALKFPGAEDVCCLTDPGCAFCPNNRLSRRTPRE